jgi:uncharacterized LabA/DUF88 family protein
MADNVVVFMDYQNVHGWARRQFLDYGSDPAEGHVDPLRVGQYLCERRSRESSLKQVRVYRGRPNPERQPGAAGANDRQTAVWERSPLVKVVRRNIRYPHDWPTSPAEEKGIDVAIAVDMIHLAFMDKTIDAIILFSSDTDLMPAIELIHKSGACHIEVASWSKGNRLRLDGTQLPWCHSINEANFRTLEDTADYSAVPNNPVIPPGLRPKLAE